jgi:uncharacterized protein
MMRIASTVALVDVTTVYVLAVILVATLVRSAVGFGEALVAVPLCAMALGGLTRLR